MTGKNKQIEFQPLGHRVLGALVSYLVPRLAADAAFKPGELDGPLVKLIPRKYDRQIPGIVGVVKEQFKNRLAQDADLDDLPEILEALGVDPDDLEGEDKKMNKDKKGKDEEFDDTTEDAGGKGKVLAILRELKIPEDKLKEIQEALAEDEEGDGDAKGEAAKKKEEEMEAADKKAKDKKAADKKAKDEENKGEGIEPKDVRQAMDAAMPAIIKATSKSVADRFQAAKDVLLILGEIQPLAFDSASDIYKEALTKEKWETKGVHPDAFKPMVTALLATRTGQTTTATVTMDEASLKSYRDLYKAPAKV